MTGGNSLCKYEKGRVNILLVFSYYKSNQVHFFVIFGNEGYFVNRKSEMIQSVLSFRKVRSYDSLCL